MDSQSGEPISRALVTIQGFRVNGTQAPATLQGPISRTVQTDTGGAYRFSGLPPARYTVRAQKPGFARLSTQPEPLAVVELQASKEDMQIALSALGVITGRVVDQNGEPMRGVSIEVLSSEVQQGLRKIRRNRTVITDDRGMYRAWDLASGKYYLKAWGQGGGGLLYAGDVAGRVDLGDSFAATYAGGGTTAEAATPIEIGPGTHATADFRLKLEPAFQIRGTLQNYDPSKGVTFTLLQNGEEGAVGPDRFNRNTGTFEIKDVVPGGYVLRARQESNAGEVAVNLNGADAEGLVLTLNSPIDIPLNIRFTNPAPRTIHQGPDGDDGDDNAFAEPLCHVSLDTMQPNPGSTLPPVILAKDGSLRNVPLGQYRVSVTCFGAYVQSAMAGRQDLLVDPVLRIGPGFLPSPIEILATHGGGVITGRLDSSAADSGGRVLIVLVPQFSPSDGPKEQIEFAVGNNLAQRFSFPNLAPGRYVVYAFARTDIEYRNPAILEALSGGQAVQIDGDEAQEITIDKVTP